MKVLSVASELYPLIKTGGLADVAGALPLALASQDIAVTSLVPGYPKVMAALGKAKRKKRVAAGTGTDVQTVNKLLKMHQEMARAMKQIKKMGGLKGLAAMFGGGGMGGPGGPMGGMGGGGLPGLGGGMGGLPGLGGPPGKK